MDQSTYRRRHLDRSGYHANTNCGIVRQSDGYGRQNYRHGSVFYQSTVNHHIFRARDLKAKINVLRNIIFSLMYMLAYSKFTNHDQSAIQIVSTVAWQDTLLSFSFISATTPILKGFTQGFKTTGLSLVYARDPITGEVSGAQTSFKLRSLTRAKRKSKASIHNTTPQVNTTSIQGRSKRNSKMMTLSPKGQDGAQCYHDESASIVSHESRQVMIRQEWEISDSYR